MFNRKCQQYLKVIVLTSLVWCLLDAFILTYFSNCADDASARLNSGKRDSPADLPGRLSDIRRGSAEEHAGVIGDDDEEKIKSFEDKNPGLFKKLLDKVPEALKPSQKMPGDGGTPVVIPEHLKAKSKEMFKINQFNLMASDMMSLNRSLPDQRMSQCGGKSYPVADLPDTSIIIVFHNEAWSTLLRTVHSAIYRSPRHLVKEIIMVDDASDQEHLKTKLEEYVAKLPVPVHIIRTAERGGLIRARLSGAEMATGDVLTFLDAHCECTEGWLEPLLYEIHKDRRNVPCPIIDVISDDTFEYIKGGDTTWGGFNWKLNFRWYQAPKREMDRRGGDRSVPMRSPTMAGGLFSIDRKYFYEVGSYDDGMNIWGGENLEMSFRIWQCGGQVLIVTCSRVGHVFRKVSPYSWPGGVSNIINHNSQRIASVWMDEYQQIFYRMNPHVRKTDPGDMTGRIQLRERLKCKSFKWYLQNIYPESHIPIDYQALGRIRNPDTNRCIDGNGKKSGEAMSLITCHDRGGNQIFVYTSDNAFRTDEVCMDAASTRDVIKLYSCHRQKGNQEFIYKNNQLVHGPSGLCVTMAGAQLSLAACNESNPSQKWEVEGFTG